METRERPPLYGKIEADSLKARELTRDDDLKHSLLLERVKNCKRLVDIGAGWGQFLSVATDCVQEIWAVDECPDRIKDLNKICPKAKVVVCRADRLELPDDYFDEYAAELRALELEDVAAAARTSLDLDDFVWVILGDRERIEGPLGELGTVRHIDADGRVIGEAAAAR